MSKFVNARSFYASIIATAVLIGAACGQDKVPAERPASTRGTNDSLRRELLDMTATDQAVRVQMMQRMKQHGMAIGSRVDANDPKFKSLMATVSAEMSAVDNKNRARLKEIVKAHGWPGVSLVGKDGANAAWLLVQHADADHDFQMNCLELMEAMPDGEIQKQQIAYLTDRVLVAEKKPQRYGTQMDAEFQPKPIDDPEHVDERRAEVGLPTLKEYLQKSREMYEQKSAAAPAAEKVAK